MRIPTLVSTLLLAGCAVLANVTPIGDGSFMTVVRSNDVNARVADQQAKAMSQAEAFCHDRGAGVEVLRQVAPAPSPGQPPSAELDFRCKSGS